MFISLTESVDEDLHKIYRVINRKDLSTVTGIQNTREHNEGLSNMADYASNCR